MMAGYAALNPPYNPSQVASASFGFQPGDLSLGVGQRDVRDCPERPGRTALGSIPGLIAEAA